MGEGVILLLPNRGKKKFITIACPGFMIELANFRHELWFIRLKHLYPLFMILEARLCCTFGGLRLTLKSF